MTKPSQPPNRRPTPHDRLFKIAFEQPAYSAQFLRYALPANLRNDLVLDSLASRRHEFVDAELASKLSDLLFSARIAHNQAQIFFIIEHQSQPDKTMPMRISAYKHGVWARQLRAEDADGLVSAVYGVLVNQGPKPWTAATELSELFRLPEWFHSKHAATLDKSQLIVIDLSAMSDQEILALDMSAAPKLALWLLKHVAADDDILASLPDVTELYEQVARDHAGSDMFTALVAYTLYSRKGSLDVLHRFFQQSINPQASEVIVSIADRLIQQGIEEGHKNGREEGIEEGHKSGTQTTLLKLLAKRFDEVPAWAHDRVQSATLGALERWVVAILDAERIEDVFA